MDNKIVNIWVFNRFQMRKLIVFHRILRPPPKPFPPINLSISPNAFSFRNFDIIAHVVSKFQVQENSNKFKPYLLKI